MADEEVKKQEDTGNGAAAAAAAAAESSDNAATKKSAYHYWHGNVAEKREKGDVAPMPVHTPLEAKPVDLDKTVYKAITVYSWCNNDKTVDVYIDWPQLNPDMVSVNFSDEFLTAEIRESETLVHRLYVKLAKAVLPDECKFKCKPAQLAIKLKKNGSEIWFDLEEKQGVSL